MKSLRILSIVAIVSHTLWFLSALGNVDEADSLLGCVFFLYCLALPQSIVALVVTSKKSETHPLNHTTDEIANLHKLLESGAITQIEYDRKKEELLARL